MKTRTKIADAATITLATVVVVAGTAGASALGATRTASTASTIPAPSTTANQGYRLVGANGSVWAFGGAHYDGEVGGRLIWPVGAAAPNGKGYWLVTEYGRVLAFGDTHNYGTAKTDTLIDPVTGMAATPDGKGYWQVTNGGSVFSFGNAHFYGSCAYPACWPRNPNSPAAMQETFGIAATPDGKGYWLWSSTGAVYAFGDAHFYGSCLGPRQCFGQQREYSEAFAATPDGKGYWLADSEGHVFAFGDAHNYGTVKTDSIMDPVTGLWNWVVGIVATPDGKGYWLADTAGDVFAFGDAHNYGSLAGRDLPYPLNEAGPGPVTGILPAQ